MSTECSSGERRSRPATSWRSPGRGEPACGARCSGRGSAWHDRWLPLERFGRQRVGDSPHRRAGLQQPLDGSARSGLRSGLWGRGEKHGMFGVLIVIHVLISLSLIVVVLLQSGKGGGLSGAFGGAGAAQTMFGGAGAATFLNKATVVLAAGFMISSLVLALLAGGFGRSQQQSVLQQTTAGEMPVAEPAPGAQVPAAGEASPATGQAGEGAPILPGAGEETEAGAGEQPQSPPPEEQPPPEETTP
ncbi:MAG: preprotein translocase subunit SecG [Candidatus Eisenbacteria bacterium]|nr:preprotein translocase subunit SecG [Candidatus Eisenbacteria bacterium]